MKVMTEIPPSINPYLKKEQYRKKNYSIEDYLKGIKNQDRVLLSKAITLIESEHPEDQKIASIIIKECLKWNTYSFRIGITGIPGVGKSTFIESFGLELTQKGHKLAVIAIDPTSERTGGSILGDKTRMENLSRNPNVFIRPSPSGRTPGGVAKRTREVILLCEAAGYDRIIIETVGVGQGETLVHSMVDFFMLLILPGSGDELQGIKRGIMEMADGIIITKADGDNLKKARIAKSDLERALHYFPHSKTGWNPPVILTSSITKLGFEDVYQMLVRFYHKMKNTIHPEKQKTFFELRREEQSLYWFEQSLMEKIKRLLFESIEEEYQNLKQKIIDKELTPFDASDKLIQYLIEKKKFIT